MRMCFYAMELSSSGLYKFVELCSLQLPKNLDDLRGMVLLLEPIADISRLYKEKCVKSSVNLQKLQCPTLPQDIMNTLLTKCKSKHANENVFYRKNQ